MVLTIYFFGPSNISTHHKYIFLALVKYPYSPLEIPISNFPPPMGNEPMGVPIGHVGMTQLIYAVKPCSAASESISKYLFVYKIYIYIYTFSEQILIENNLN